MLWHGRTRQGSLPWGACRRLLARRLEFGMQSGVEACRQSLAGMTIPAKRHAALGAVKFRLDRVAFSSRLAQRSDRLSSSAWCFRKLPARCKMRSRCFGRAAAVWRGSADRLSGLLLLRDCRGLGGPPDACRVVCRRCESWSRIWRTCLRASAARTAAPLLPTPPPSTHALGSKQTDKG